MLFPNLYFQPRLGKGTLDVWELPRHSSNAIDARPFHIQFHPITSQVIGVQQGNHNAKHVVALNEYPGGAAVSIQASISKQILTMPINKIICFLCNFNSVSIFFTQYNINSLLNQFFKSLFRGITFGN